MQNSPSIVIVGGGAAGITVAASLEKKLGGGCITLIEPSEVHYYQPAFTLVGAGAYNLANTRRSEASLIPNDVTWIKDHVTGFEPDSNRVETASSGAFTYDYLVVATGLQLLWDKVEGLKEAVGQNGVCSNYAPETVEYTWECVQALQPGQTALFTQPPLPFKCPGAPQKIAYLTADHLRKSGRDGACDLKFLTDAPGMFGVPFFAKELKKVADAYGIDTLFQHNLIAVNAADKTATFEKKAEGEAGQTVTLGFDLLHASPPQGPIKVVAESALANEGGYVDVHQNSMQSTKFSNVFALGDACSTPNSKTAAAVRKQSPVVVQNIINLANGKEVVEGYDGYGSCPLTTAYGKVILAEFIYGGKVTPTFALDPRAERASMWWVKKTGLPLMYWEYMLKGREWFFEHKTDYVEPTAA